MPRKKKKTYWLPCHVCGKLVKILTEDRYVRIKETHSQVFCGQCRKYVRNGSEAVAAVASEFPKNPLALRHKSQKHAKHVGRHESCPIGRCAVRGDDCEEALAVELRGLMASSTSSEIDGD